MLRQEALGQNALDRKTVQKLDSSYQKKLENLKTVQNSIFKRFFETQSLSSLLENL